MRLTTIISIVAVGAAVSVLGCGGGGGSSIAAGENRSPGSATVTIQWPKTNSRLIPSGTSMVKVSMHNEANAVADPAPQPATNASGSPPTKSVRFDGLVPGTWTMTAEAYTGTDLASPGTLLATGKDTRVINPGVDTAFGIEMGSEIKWVKVTATSTGSTGTTTLGLGEEITLTASGMTKSPTDATAALVPVAASTQIKFEPSSNALVASSTAALQPNKSVQQKFKANQMATGVTVNVTLTDPNDQNFSKTGSFTVDVVAPGYGVFDKVGIPGTSDDIAADYPYVYYTVNAGDLPAGGRADIGVFRRDVNNPIVFGNNGNQLNVDKLTDTAALNLAVEHTATIGGGDLIALEAGDNNDATKGSVEWFSGTQKVFKTDKPTDWYLREATTTLAAGAAKDATTISVKHFVPKDAPIRIGTQSTTVQAVAGTASPFTLTLVDKLAAATPQGSVVYIKPSKGGTRISIDKQVINAQDVYDWVAEGAYLTIGSNVGTGETKEFRVVRVEDHPDGGYNLTLDTSMTKDHTVPSEDFAVFSPYFDFTVHAACHNAPFDQFSVIDKHGPSTEYCYIDRFIDTNDVANPPGNAFRIIRSSIDTTNVTGIQGMDSRGGKLYVAARYQNRPTILRYSTSGGSPEVVFDAPTVSPFVPTDVVVNKSYVYAIGSGAVHVFTTQGKYVYSVGPKIGEANITRVAKGDIFGVIDTAGGYDSLAVMATDVADIDNKDLNAIYVLGIPVGSRAAPQLQRVIPIGRGHAVTNRSATIPRK